MHTHFLGGRVSCGLYRVPSAWSQGTTADLQAACPLWVSLGTTSSVKSSGGGGSWLLCRCCTCQPHQLPVCTHCLINPSFSPMYCEHCQGCDCEFVVCFFFFFLGSVLGNRLCVDRRVRLTSACSVSSLSVCRGSSQDGRWRLGR